MRELKEDWITNGLIDFEYKKFTLLAYLKYVRENFDDRKLYPFLADLVFHYKNLIMIKDSKKFIYENFPRTISKIDFENLRITYKKILKDDALMQEIEDIVEYALEKVGLSLRVGREIYDEIENGVEIMPVGLSPLQNNEGYLFLACTDKKDFMVYRYMISIFRNADETYRAVSTDLIGDYHYSLINTYEQVKTDLIRTYRQLPNPATYLLRSKIEVPFEETFLPLAKRILVRYVKAA
jgi:hypothetical protein